MCHVQSHGITVLVHLGQITEDKFPSSVHNEMPEFVCLESADAEFAVFDEEVDFLQAASNCQAAGATLAAIMSQDEFNFVRGLTDRVSGLEAFWIGKRS